MVQLQLLDIKARVASTARNGTEPPHLGCVAAADAVRDYQYGTIRPELFATTSALYSTRTLSLALIPTEN